MLNTVNVKVITRARENDIRKTDDGYVVRTTAVPSDGEANEVVLKMLAKELGVRVSALTIIRGETNRNKVISVEEPKK